MEHIPRVRRPAPGSTVDVVPLLGNPTTYGNHLRHYAGFETFPESHGYTATGFKLGDDHQSPDFSFLQLWLFFGLLAEVFGDPSMKFDCEDFVDTQSVPPRLSTAELTRYIWYWQARRQHEALDDVVEHALEVDKCLQLVNCVTNNLAHAIKLGDLQSPINSVLLSIVLLAEHLSHARAEIVQRGIPKRLDWDFPPVHNALCKAGWCVGEVAILERDCNLTCRYYLSTFDRNELQKDNPKNKSLRKDHSNCTPQDGCRAHQIQMSTYPTRHTLDCPRSLDDNYPSCKRIGPPILRILHEIEAGSYPLVEYGFDGAFLEVYPANQGNIYVAISHVWSDGLGNKEDNTLNECQINRIQKLVDELYPEDSRPVKFWIDTFGVPVGAEYYYVKQKAINRMADTYRLADKVLVLDNCLQYCSEESPWVEMNMRIRYCPWMTRVWTMMEGMSNGSLFFQFKGRARRADDLRDTPKRLRNLLAVSDLLEKLGDEGVVLNSNAMRLVGALAMYEPLQQRPNESISVEGVVGAHNDYPEQPVICDRWLPVVFSRGTVLGEADGHLRSDIHVNILCTVVESGLGPLLRLRGTTYPTFVDLAREQGAASASNKYPPSSLFSVVCRGLPGRTTSRIEDELDCLSLLLGTDVSEIERIQPLHWKTKERLNWFQSFWVLRVMLPYFGIDIPRQLSDCRERRMKALLSQVGIFPATIVFWDAPRLPFNGWKWAPASFLHPKLDFRVVYGGQRGKLTPRGIQVQLPAFRLSSLPAASEFNSTKSDLSTIIGKEEILHIHTADDSGVGLFAMRRAWQRLRVFIPKRGPVHWWEKPIKWSEIIANGTLGQFVVLVELGRSEWTTKGALLEIYGADGSVVLVNHITLVEKVINVNVDGLVIYVNGTWDPLTTWCVG